MTSPPELSMEYWRAECQRLAGLLSEARSDRNATVARLEAEKRGLEEDKARLDWLETQGRIGSWIAMYEDHGGPESWKTWEVTEPQADGYEGSGMTVRQAIDAARYRAACPGEGQPSNASNSPTASRESQG
jgi:hypothetical protein